MASKPRPRFTDADFLYQLIRYGEIVGCLRLEEIVMLETGYIERIGDTSCRWARYAMPKKAAYILSVRESKHPSLFALQKALIMYAQDMCIENIDRFVYGVAVEDLTGPG